MKRNNKQKYFRSGLTLIELIVSISIIAFITTIFVSNYNDSNKRTDLVMSAQSLVADIHQVQNNSLGLIEYGTELPGGGWGLSFNLDNKNQYIMFADLENPGEYGYMRYSTDEGDIDKGAKIIDLPPQTEISALRIANDIPVSSANVTFLPPDPRTNINYGSSATSTVLEVDIKELNNNSIKTIRVNFLGLAEVLESLESNY